MPAINSPTPTPEAIETLGDAAVPRPWLGALVEREVVEAVADDLLAHVPDGAGEVAFDTDRYPPW